MTVKLRPRGSDDPAVPVEGTRLNRNARPPDGPSYQSAAEAVNWLFGNETGCESGGDDVQRPRRPAVNLRRRAHDRRDAVDNRLLSVPSGMLADRSLLSTDLVIALAIAATVAPGDVESTASVAVLMDLSGFKERAVQESLIRLADGDWIVSRYEGGSPGVPSRRTTTLMWVPDDDGSSEGGA
jgi:hypothetical protein